MHDERVSNIRCATLAIIISGITSTTQPCPFAAEVDAIFMMTFASRTPKMPLFILRGRSALRACMIYDERRRSARGSYQSEARRPPRRAEEAAARQEDDARWRFRCRIRFRWRAAKRSRHASAPCARADFASGRVYISRTGSRAARAPRRHAHGAQRCRWLDILAADRQSRIFIMAQTAAQQPGRDARLFTTFFAHTYRMLAT